METVICRFCKKKIPKETAYKEGEKNYFCSFQHSVLQEQKSKYKPKKLSTDGSQNPRRNLTDLIQEYYIEQGIEKHTINWSVETARIKNILDEHKDWKITGLIYTLKYMHDIECLNLFTDQTNCVMALVPFYYTKAMEYYNQTVELKKQFQNYEFINEPKIIKKHIENNNRKKYIDLNNL